MTVAAVAAEEEEIGVFKGTKAAAGNLSVRRRRHRVLYIIYILYT